MIGRAGAEVDVVVLISRVIGWDGRVGLVDALGAARRPRRIEHGVAAHRIGDVLAGMGREGGLIVQEARQGAADRHLQGQAWALLGGMGRAGHRGLGEKGAGLAVADHIGDLVRRQVPVHRRHAQAAALGGEQHVDELGPVGTEQGDGIAGLEALVPQEPGDAVRIGVELSEGAGRPRHLEDGDLFRLPGGPEGWRHAELRGRLQGGCILVVESSGHGASLSQPQRSRGRLPRWPARPICRTSGANVTSAGRLPHSGTCAADGAGPQIPHEVRNGAEGWARPAFP